MKKIALFPVLLLLALLAATLTPVQAQDPVEPIEPPIIIDPPPRWRLDGLEIAYQYVDVTIADQVATTHIEQLFVNDNAWILEGTYLFPLPRGAAVSQLTMWVDGQPIEAKILEADEARSIYDAIVRQLRDPALLEYVGSQAIQANVFPIPARHQRRIEIEYSQVLPAENGLLHYVFPQATDLYTNTRLNSQRIRVDVQSEQALRTIYSPSHPVAIDRRGEFAATVGYEASDVSAETDFELFYSVSPEEIGLNLLSYKAAGEDGFFLLLVAPTVEIDATEVIAKDVILVLDTSGSMDGAKLAQAQQAARFVVERLNDSDRFNIIAFSTGVRVFARQMAPADEPGDYAQFINSFEAGGGTNISQALLEAAAQADRERPTTIIFLTDGLATEGITDSDLLLDTVRQQMPDNVRLFAFGVGNDVDTFLLDSLARDHGGATTYVRPFQEIDEAVSAFYGKISTPVLADIELDFDEIIVEQVYPQQLPDLFAGSQLILAGRYRSGGPATVTLSGEVNGRQQSFVYDDQTFSTGGGQSFIARLWATRAIGHLLTQIRLQGEDSELVQSVVNLSIRYGIITPYTSYLIEEDDIFTQTGRDEILEDAEAYFTAPQDVSGERAVEAAAAEAELAAAVAPQPTPSASIVSASGQVVAPGELMRQVGSKTFVQRDGVWIDTVFDADGPAPQQVDFASDTYFDLLSAAPALGQYLAIGPRIVVVYEGVAYEIVQEGEGQETITLPDPDTGEATPQQPSDAATTVPDSSSAGSAGQGSSLCGLALMIPLAIVGLVGWGWRRRQQWRE
ncbi:MAG: VIT domain-containing protein [Candidatus Promineifilaceae bacterium]|nr:VIT domain-containing protein [Candidatus Promineifilaceae bacterium]